MTTHQTTHDLVQAHAYLDHLSPAQVQAVRSLLETMLSPLDRTLVNAPIDDEPVGADEAAAIQAGIDSLDRGEGVPLEHVLADFGLTPTDLRRMAAEPDSSNGNG